MGRAESELEGFVLGLVWQFGPCTAYDIRRLLLDSPSAQWSGSAGAVYPLVGRLSRRGLLTARPARTGKRLRTEYRLSSAGRSALVRWIGPPLSNGVITVPHDPLRSRVRFLAALPPASRKRWLRAAENALIAILSKVEAWDAEYGSRGDPYLAAMTDQARADVRTRCAWLRSIARAR